MQKTPTVSIGLPAYKAAYFRTAIESLLAQTYPHFELIIVNDASPEDLTAIVNSYTDPRIRYYINEENLGKTCIVKTWNRCLSYATGDYFVLASDDDIYHPRFLEKLIARALEQPATNVFHCRISVVDENENLLSVALPCLTHESQLEFIFNRTVLRRQQVAPDFMSRTSRLREIGGFIELPLGWYSDDLTWFHLADHGVGYIEDPLFKWRLSKINISGSPAQGEQKALAAFEFHRRLFDLIRTLAPANEREAYWLGKINAKGPSAIFIQMVNDILPLTHLHFCKLFLQFARRRDYPRRFLPYMLFKKIQHTLGIEFHWP